MHEKRELWAFPGLHYFNDDPVDQQLFFGREQEIKQLSERIIAEDITVLFGKSGDGKTSLINAGLKPAFRELGYLPVRARIFNSPENISPLQAIYQAIAAEAEMTKMHLPADWQQETLWETFFRLQPTAQNHLKPVVLIFDQFEELFTLLAARQQHQEDFIRQFADLVRGRLPEKVREKYRGMLQTLEAMTPEARDLEKLLYGAGAPVVKILISLREDYLAFLDHLGKRIPKVYHSRYRLPSLTLEQARDAIIKPPYQKILAKRSFHIDNAAIEKIMQFLTMQSSASGISAEIVGPPQLQVLCRQLEEQMRQQGKSSIGVNDLGGDKGMRRLLSRYYRSIRERFSPIKLGAGPKKLPGIFGILRRLQPVHSPRLAVRHLCEDRLITAGGNRNSRHEDEIVHEIGVAKTDVEKLVDSRLLRREPRLQEAFYELSHDSLVPSLQTAGGLRKAWTTSIRVTMAAVLVLAGLQFGLPYVRSFFNLDNLRSELSAVKQREITVEYFRTQLRRAHTTIADSGKVAEIKNDFDDWRMNNLRAAFLAVNPTATDQAESVLEALKQEYPRQEFLIDELSDSLRQRQIRLIERRYRTLVQASDDEPSQNEIKLDNAQKLLDSAYVAFDRDVRFTELLAGLAQRRGNLTEQKQLQAEAQRQRQLAKKQLLAAIKLREPRADVVKGDNRSNTSLQIVLQDNRLLQNARVFLNNSEIKYQQGSKEKSLQGILNIPIRVAKITAAIKAIDKEGNEASRTFTFAVDRQPPEIKMYKVFYRNNAQEQWQAMPKAKWPGSSWRITGEASEALQSVILMINFTTRQLPMRFTGTIAANGREITFAGSNEKLNDVGVFDVSLEMLDKAGWKNTFELGRWQIPEPVIGQEFTEQKKSGKQQSLRLRSVFDKELAEQEVRNMIKKYDFYCQYNSWKNPDGKGIVNDFILQKNKQVVLDKTTGLMWQQSGSENYIILKDANKYIQELNRNKFVGYSDWRLPTLEEAMSLMEPKKSGVLYIDAIFDREQRWIWTGDKHSVSRAWVVNFFSGNCSHNPVDDYCSVRAVRAGQSNL